MSFLPCLLNTEENVEKHIGALDKSLSKQQFGKSDAITFAV